MTSVLRDLVSKATPGPIASLEPIAARQRLDDLAPDLALLVADLADELREEKDACADCDCTHCEDITALLVRVDRLTEDKG